MGRVFTPDRPASRSEALSTRHSAQSPALPSPALRQPSSVFRHRPQSPFNLSVFQLFSFSLGLRPPSASSPSILQSFPPVIKPPCLCSSTAHWAPVVVTPSGQIATRFTISALTRFVSFVSSVTFCKKTILPLGPRSSALRPTSTALCPPSSVYRPPSSRAKRRLPLRSVPSVPSVKTNLPLRLKL